MSRKGLLEIKEHSIKKYRILAKYLDACIMFQKKYKNFAYIDTHGGSGNVLFKGELKDGSILTAVKSELSKVIHGFPCYVTEINPDRYNLLKESVREFSNVTVIHGNCNEKVSEIISKLPDWKFILCFVDPDGLVYTHGNFRCHQLMSETIEKIGCTKKSELLLNFQVNAIQRLKGYINQYPNNEISQQYEKDITTLFGSRVWEKNEIGLDKRNLLNAFISERLEKHYDYIGATLIKVRGSPLYYLVYASKHHIGAKIMRDIMYKERGLKTLNDYKKVFPINRFIFE